MRQFFCLRSVAFCILLLQYHHRVIVMIISNVSLAFFLFYFCFWLFPIRLLLQLFTYAEYMIVCARSNSICGLVVTIQFRNFVVRCCLISTSSSLLCIPWLMRMCVCSSFSHWLYLLSAYANENKSYAVYLVFGFFGTCTPSSNKKHWRQIWLWKMFV